MEQMKITQKDRIINYIREFGSITSWEAYQDLGVMQLGARIDQLQKDGHVFRTETFSSIHSTSNQSSTTLVMFVDTYLTQAS